MHVLFVDICTLNIFEMSTFVTPTEEVLFLQALVGYS